MKNVRLIAFDVDGTLTDGGIYFGASGEDIKRFNILDGLGFRLAASAGLVLAVVSGRTSAPVTARMKVLGVDEISQGVDDKFTALSALREKYKLTREQIAFVGDDVNDIPAFEAVGVRIAVQNASPHLKKLADFVTPSTGGNGAAREAIEAILDAQGRLDEAIQGFVDGLRVSSAGLSKQ